MGMNTLVIISTIVSMGRASTNGLMGVYTLVNSNMALRRAKANGSTHQ